MSEVNPEAAAACVDIVIVNWNAGGQLRACVESIARYGDGLVARVIVVDNASTDGSIDGPFADTPPTVVRSPTNLGFGAACNRGAALGSAPFILFFNPDAELREGTLSRTVAAMRESAAEDVALCGVRLVDDDGRLQRHCSPFPTVWTFAGQSMGLQGRLGLPSFTMADFDHERDADVGSVIGAFYFIRRIVFEELDGFDERFFVYYEELDLSLRVRRAGWRTRYLAEPVALHRGGGTTDKVKALRMFYALRSRLLYSFKNLPRAHAWAVVGFTFVIEPVGRVARAVVRRSMAEVRESVGGYAMLLREAPGIAAAVRRGGRRRDEP